MFKYLFGLLVLASLSSCDKWTKVDATGLVRDAASQMPLDSAHVMLYEDNDDPFMGSHLLQETTTDASGTFKFNFDYKEGPYKIFVNRPRYRYDRVESDNIVNETMVFEYQTVAAMEDEQDFIFDMAPQSFLKISLKNVAPAATTDQLKLEVGRNYRNRNAFIRTFEGVITEQISVGNVDGNTYIPIKYEVRENDVWRTVKDSIAIQPFKTATYQLNYYAGYTIPPNYDSMIAKLITVAQTREEAIVKMKRALSEFVVEGIKTTIPFHLKMMDDENFKAGNFTTSYLDTWDFSQIEA